MEPFSALVLSNDPGALGVTQKVLEEYAFTTKVTASALMADQAIRATKFDLGVYDNDIPGAMQLAAPNALANAPKMVFAVTRSATAAEVAGKRVHFIVQKPFTADLFSRSLRAAFGVMLKERRVAYRHPVRISPASCFLVRENGAQNLGGVTILDVSQTGMCLQASGLLNQGATLQIKFPLAEANAAISVGAFVVWTRASGRAGVRITDITPEQQKILNDWLDSRMPLGQEFIPRAMTPPEKLRDAQARTKSM